MPVRAHQQAAAVVDAADPPPVTADVVIELAVADRTRRQPSTEIGSGLLGGTDPRLAADSHDERQLLGRTDVQRGHRVGAGLQPHVGQPAARTRARRVVELLIACRGRGVAPVRDNRAGAVALAELDAVSVELVVLQLDGALQLLATGGAGGAGLGELVQTRPALVHALVGPEPESGGDREHVGDALHRAVDDLLADRLAFVVVAVEQVVAGLPGQHHAQLPAQVVGVLDGGVAAQPVGGRVPVRGVPGEEDAALPETLGDDVVDLPLPDRLDRDVHRGVTDGLVCPGQQRLRRQVRLALRRVVHEQQHPLGPRLDADPRPAADPKVVAGLADPVQDPRAVRGVLGQVGLEPHVDRGTECSGLRRPRSRSGLRWRTPRRFRVPGRRRGPRCRPA